ncbi:VIT1/CCC1 transporter family protein [Actinoplanes sp. CA-252034]|uniref:VIT1/CCC1 transporter family protein n=1 Tax=Actinoplanes sp. CA-252034 TaxID=3239906 RepID=UPI003D98CB45
MGAIDLNSASRAVNDQDDPHADAVPGIVPVAPVSPWHAAGVSAVSFALGAALPLLTILVLSVTARVPVTFLVVLLALALTGALAATIGDGRRTPAVLQTVLGGMAFTYAGGRPLRATTL